MNFFFFLIYDNFIRGNKGIVYTILLLFVILNLIVKFLINLIILYYNYFENTEISYTIA